MTTIFIFQSYEKQATNLAGQIAFLKMYSTRCAQDTARDAVQIFGGRGITQTGMGRFIEHASHLLVLACCAVTELSLLCSVLSNGHFRFDSGRR